MFVQLARLACLVCAAICQSQDPRPFFTVTVVNESGGFHQDMPLAVEGVEVML